MAYLPMAVYGLEVPPGDMAVSARPDIPAAFRITMAAIDPTAEAEGVEGAAPRATLKIIRLPLTEDDFDIEDEDDFDPDEMDAILNGGADDSEEDEDDDDEDDEDDAEVNGGPSDPAKTKAARKQAATDAIKKLLEAEGMDVDDTDGVDGAPKSAKARGKMPVTNMDEDDDDEDDEDDVEVNGGPSDPAKTKAARKQAATDAIKKLLEAEGMDVDDTDGVDDDEDDEEDSDDDGAEIEEFVICTLDPQKQYQQTLDITIGEDERVWFKVTGTHSIYLTGNYIEPANGPYDEEDSEDDDELDYDLEPDSDELDDEELDALDELADPISRVTELEDDEEAPELVKPKKGKNKRAVEDIDTSENLDELIAKDIAGTDKLSKKQAKKQKKNDGTAAAVATNGKAETPASAKSDKKVAFAKEIEQGPTPSKAAEANGSGSVSVKSVQGVKIDVRKTGTGPVAKKGDRVSMRYIGKLQDGKVFDSNKKGKPFSFKLGAGEVIKGWDIGVAGQNAGSEFRLTIPPHLAYGSKNMGDIPPNSTLIFDLKVLEINKK